MASDNQTMSTLQQENQQLREQVAQLKQALAESQQQMERLPTMIEQSQEILRAFLDNLPAVIYATDTEGRLLLANQQWSAAVGMSVEQALGKTMPELFGEEMGGYWVTQNQKIMETGIIDEQEEVMQQPDGPHTYHSMRFPIRSQAGNVYGMGGISTDITERKQQEDELRMFKALVENAPGMISVSNIDGTYQYFNPAFRERLNIAPDAPPHNYQIADMSPPEVVAELGNLVPHIIEQGFWRRRSIFQTQDGERFPGDLAVFVTRDADGNPQQFIAIANDISDQVAAEAERESLQEQLINAQRDALRELSTPLIPISDEVVIMPLIGTIDSGRAQMVLETLLEGVARYQASLAILDITGVVTVDTQVAQALVGAARAVRLLGAQVMLTGIQPQIAQTLVHLGVDLSGIQTQGSLQAGIAAALRNQA
jgi:PAS domain S-box-containing protein